MSDGWIYFILNIYMEWSKIAYVLIVIIILYYFISWFTATSVSLSKIKSAEDTTAIPKKSTQTTKARFPYSIWFNIKDWSIRYGKTKDIYVKTKAESGRSVDDSEVAASDNVLSMSLDPNKNDLIIKIRSKGATTGAANPLEPIIINNIPLQKWVNVIVSIDTRSVDVYMNGKLVKSHVLLGTPELGGEDHQVHLTPGGGFSGETANFRYYDSAISPQEGWEIYKGGYGAGMFSGLLNKYKLKVAFMKDDVEYNALVI